MHCRIFKRKTISWNTKRREVNSKSDSILVWFFFRLSLCLVFALAHRIVHFSHPLFQICNTYTCRRARQAALHRHDTMTLPKRSLEHVQEQSTEGKQRFPRALLFRRRVHRTVVSPLDSIRTEIAPNRMNFPISFRLVKMSTKKKRRKKHTT